LPLTNKVRKLEVSNNLMKAMQDMRYIGNYEVYNETKYGTIPAYRLYSAHDM